MRKVAKAIKGTSTHAIDRKLHSHEAVWQEESFDHVLRSSESLDAKIDYVLQNPVRKGLVRIAREYPWSWRKPMDHQDRSRRGGCPHPPSDAEHRKALASTARQPGRGRPGLREPWWLGAGAATKRKPRPSAAWAGHPVESRCSVGSATRRRFFLTVALSELARDLSIKTQTVREVFNRPTIGEGYNWTGRGEIPAHSNRRSIPVVAVVEREIRDENAGLDSASA